MLRHAGCVASAYVQSVGNLTAGWAPRPQVDICLYLLPPRRLAASDAAFLRRLSPLVAVQLVSGVAEVAAESSCNSEGV